MTIKIWELGSNLSWKDGVGSTERITQSSVNFLLHLMNGSMFVKKPRQKSEHLWDLLHIQVNENTFTDTESFFFRIDRFLLHCFSQLTWIYHCYFLLIFFCCFMSLNPSKMLTIGLPKKLATVLDLLMIYSQLMMETSLKIYPCELILILRLLMRLLRLRPLNSETTFLDLYLCINED